MCACTDRKAGFSTAISIGATLVRRPLRLSEYSELSVPMADASCEKRSLDCSVKSSGIVGSFHGVNVVAIAD